MTNAIRVENLSKAYQLGDFGTGTISRDVERFWAKVRGKEDPFLKIGEVNDRTTRSGSDIVWSLKDLNFDIEQGDAVGVIGRNGAGKSTLLKILSRVTSPTTGTVRMKGRIASLLEVGTGFHPELTGKENIYLNGAILGMRRTEIKRKFDEIVDFAGVDRYIDTPVKRYSSGMYVRLAFAVAAHLESEILVVDEVLAVGDAEFQKKCLGKIGDVSKGEGRTVLFVSHNMSSVSKICNNAILLTNGKLSCSGPVNSIIGDYLRDAKTTQSVFDILPPLNKQDLPGYAMRVQIEDREGNAAGEIPVGKLWQIRVSFKINRPVNHFIIGIGITTQMDVNLRTAWSSKTNLEEGYYEAVVVENNLLLSAGFYKITLGLSSKEHTFHYVEDAALFTISHLKDDSLDSTILRIDNSGIILNPMLIDISKQS